MRRLFWVPLFAVLAACPGPIDTGADGGGAIVVGPEGGKFIREGAYIEIPSNAVSSETTITLEIIDDDNVIPAVPNRKRISYGYRFRPTALKFNEPVTISVPYLEDRIPAAGIDPSTFDMRRGTGDDPYLALPSPNTVTEAKSVVATSDSLGLFWVTSPPRPAVNELKLEPSQATLMVGQTQQFTARVTDPAGNEIPGVEVKWSILPARVAKVDATGLVEALAPGTATLTVTAGDIQQTATVAVIGTTEGPSTFLHENPFPTGNDLHGGVISGSDVFFVGGNATVLQESGTSWQRLYSTPAVTLNAIAGGLPGGAVAVGVSGNAGVLVEVTDPTKAPSVQVLKSVEPLALAFDGTYGMAVGTGNDVVIRRDGKWVTDYSPSFETLLDVKGDGAGGFVTIGSRGSLYIYDPATMTWDSLFQTQLNVLLTGAVITDGTGSEAWAIGGNKLWHFAQQSWTAVNLPSSPTFETLTAIGMIDGKVIVGARQALQPYLFVYDPSGGSWGATTTLRLQQVVRGVFGSGNDGYAVGDLGSIWRYQNGTFSEVSDGFYGDVADVYSTEAVQVAAVNECSDPMCANRDGRVVIRGSDGVWSELGTQSFFGPLYGIAATSANDVYATGEGNIWHYDGTSWLPNFVSTAPIYDVAVCGTSVWAVGAGGTVFKGTGSSFLPQNPLGQNDLRSVFCANANEVWIAGDMSLYKTTTLIRDPAVNHAPYNAVWSPGPNEAYAFGDARYGVYYNTKNLNVIDAPGGVLPEQITGLWGSSVDNLYAVGWTVNPLTFGYGLRFNGAQWSLVDIGAQQKPTSIHGYSNTDIFVGTAGGGILRGVPPAK